MPLYRYVLLPCILLLCFAWPCLAAEQQHGERALCGDYSYILPEGFSAFDMPQSYEGKIYLNRSEHDVYSQADNKVICIQTKNTDNKDFILDTIQILRTVPKAKHDIELLLKQYKKIFKDDTIVYYYYNNTYNGMISWASVFFEINAHDSAKHTILYFNSAYFRRNVKKGRRTVTVEMSDEDLKQLALKFIDSIQKVR